MPMSLQGHSIDLYTDCLAKAGKRASASALSEQLGAHLSRIAAGDQTAMETLYIATSAKLLGTIICILNDRCESEDILQDVYVAVWQNAGQYKAALGRPMAWLTTLARNKAIDRLRRRRRVEADGGKAAIRLVDPEPCAFTQIERKQQSAHVQRCLDRLEPRAASALRMAFYEGITYRAVAERLGMTEGTAKSIIRRRLIDLRSEVLL